MFIDARTPNSDLRSIGARCSGNGLCVRVMFRSFRSEEDSFGGHAFYKYYVPTGRKIGRRQTLWGSVKLDS